MTPTGSRRGFEPLGRGLVAGAGIEPAEATAYETAPSTNTLPTRRATGTIPSCFQGGRHPLRPLHLHCFGISPVARFVSSGAKSGRGGPSRTRTCGSRQELVHSFLRVSGPRGMAVRWPSEGSPVTSRSPPVVQGWNRTTTPESADFHPAFPGGLYRLSYLTRLPENCP